MLNAELRDDCDSSEDLAVAPDVVAVGVFEDLPCLEASVDSLVARSHTGLLWLVLDGVTWVVRTLDLVGCTNVSVVSLDALTWFEELAEDPVADLNIRPQTSWVWTVDPYQLPPENTHPDLVPEGGFSRILVGGEGVPF